MGCGSWRSISDAAALQGRVVAEGCGQGVEESVERIKLLEGWSTRRSHCPGWPGNDAFLYLIDRQGATGFGVVDCRGIAPRVGFVPPAARETFVASLSELWCS